MQQETEQETEQEDEQEIDFNDFELPSLDNIENNIDNYITSILNDNKTENEELILNDEDIQKKN